MIHSTILSWQRPERNIGRTEANEINDAKDLVIPDTVRLGPVPRHHGEYPIV